MLDKASRRCLGGKEILRGRKSQIAKRIKEHHQCSCEGSRIRTWSKRQSLPRQAKSRGSVGASTGPWWRAWAGAVREVRGEGGGGEKAAALMPRANCVCTWCT